MVVFLSEGAQFNVLGRLRQDKVVPQDAIADVETRAEAEKLRQHILALDTKADESDLVDLLQKINGLTVAFDSAASVNLTAEQRVFYRASLYRAMHRLRIAMVIPG